MWVITENQNHCNSPLEIYLRKLMQQFPLLLLHPHNVVHTSFDFLHLHRSVAHPVVHLQKTISKQALGTGSYVIRTGTRRSFVSLQPADSSGFGMSGLAMWACRHIIAW